MLLYYFSLAPSRSLAEAFRAVYKIRQKLVSSKGPLTKHKPVQPDTEATLQRSDSRRDSGHEEERETSEQERESEDHEGEREAGDREEWNIGERRESIDSREGRESREERERRESGERREGNGTLTQIAQNLLFCNSM